VNQGAGVFTLDIGPLAAGATGTSSFVVHVISPAPAGVNNIVNSLAIADDASNGPDPTPGNTAVDTDVLNAAPDLTVVTSDGGLAAVVPGGVVTYAINYANTGNQDATGVVLSVQLPGGNAFSFNIGNLAVGASGSASVGVVVPANATAPLTNTVGIADDAGNGADPTPANNTSSDSTDVLLAPTITGITQNTGGAATPLMTSDNTLLIHGTAQPGKVIEVSLAGGLIGTTTSDTQGAWTFNHTGTTLADGPHTFTAIARQGSVPSLTSNALLVTVDTIAPTVAVSAPSVALTDRGPVTFTVTFSDANPMVVSLLAANITLNATGTAAGTVLVGAGPTANTRIVTIQDIHGNGTLGISVGATTAADLAGNLAGTATSPTFQVQGSRQLTVTARGPKTAKRGAIAVYSIQFANIGNQLSRDAVLVVQLPKFASFVSSRSTQGWQKVGRSEFRLPRGTVNIGAGGTVSFAVKFSAAAPLNAQVLLKASIRDLLGGAADLAVSSVKTRLT
jgi:uncharacterized repeat protein (TIGR01451 family)